MNKINLIVLTILALGLAAGLVLVQRPQIFKPKAAVTGGTCTSSVNTALNSITWTVSGLSGGVSANSYNYTWIATGTSTGITTITHNSLGPSDSVTIGYTSNGTKTMSVSVYSGTVKNINCPSVTLGVAASPSPGSFTGTCGPKTPAGAPVSSVGLYESVNWTATLSPSTGSYFFTWSGSDNLSGNGNPVTKSYSTAGTKTASVIVTLSPTTITLNCTSLTVGSSYSQSSYGSGGYSQSTYYSQSSYSGGYSQSSYSIGYSQTSYGVGPTPTPTPTPIPTATATPTASPTTLPTPTPSPTPVRTTKEYRIAENAADLSSAQWQLYSNHLTEIYYTFKNDSFGTKQLCAQFKASDGTISAPTCELAELIDPPEITGCNLSFGTGYVDFALSGKNFSTETGWTDADLRPLQIISWTNEKVVARYSNPPVGQSFTVNLINGANLLKAVGECSAISQLAVGARLFCPQVKQTDISGVSLSLKNLDNPQNPVVRETVTLGKEGLILGLKTKLVEENKYLLAIDVPKGIRKTTEFTAVKDTTNVDFTSGGQKRLPLGDIFPLAGGDGSINTLDKSQLNREWVTSVAGSARAADLNTDGRVNSFDWACMKQDFGATDDEF